MKKISLIIFLGGILSALLSIGQENSYFVKYSGDTIRCEITRVTDLYLFYSVNNIRSRIELEEIKFHTGLATNELLEIEEDSITQLSLPFDIVYEEFENARDRQPIRLLVNLAGGYRIAQAVDLPRSYVNQLRTGIQYNIKAQFFGKSDTGFGAEFHQFFNKAEGNIRTIGDVSDNITISFFGASYVQRVNVTETGNRSYFDASVGVVFYENLGELNGQAINIEGTTAGISLAYGYDVAVLKNISVGFEIGVLLGRLNSVRVNGQAVTAQNPQEAESLTRINFGMGVRFLK